MREITVFDRGDRVAIVYEIDGLLFKNGTIYYKLKNPATGTYLENAYTAKELLPVPTGVSNEEG